MLNVCVCVCVCMYMYVCVSTICLYYIYMCFLCVYNIRMCVCMYCACVCGCTRICTGMYISNCVYMHKRMRADANYRLYVVEILHACYVGSTQTITICLLTNSLSSSCSIDSLRYKSHWFISLQNLLCLGGF